MKYLFSLAVIFSIISFVSAQKLKVSDNQRFLVTEDGKPFFWLADTAWELFHRCNREEAEMYLKKRSEQGFNVVQAVALAEIDGLNVPNSYGQTPLVKNDPTKPNEKYFEHIDDVIKMADSLGIYIALLPTWGDKLYKDSWGVGPEIFNKNNARVFGNWIGNRYKDYDNIIWVIGSDRTPRENTDDVEVWNQMAEGIAESAGGYENTLMSFHPQPEENGGSSTWFHNEKWLDFNMHQTGHCAKRQTYKNIAHDYNLKPVKPTLDAEPLYEDHPNCFNAKELGHSVPADIRRIMYWNVFAGAFGQTYGCHDVWQMYKVGREGINQPLRPWPLALELPMANQVKHLKNLFLSRPFLSRIPDQSMISEEQSDNNDYVSATRDKEGTYAFFYFPTGRKTTLDISNLQGENFYTWWYDVRTGATFKGDQISKDSSKIQITPPSKGKGNDWVFVVDSTLKNYPPPGTIE
ncbi:MAG: hypothetical protein CR989_04765 [Flavobacteriales bacterium]|nr:MAG: hypothetical protein CR989_04765 [Flavobacteriales bacterium]